MKNCNSPSNQTTSRILLIACATAFAVAFTVSLPQPGQADDVTPPRMPANIQVPPGNTAFLVGHAVGTQNYICRPSSTSISGVAFTLFTPRPPCSATITRKSLPTSSAPTRLRVTLIRRWWPLAWFAPRGSIRGTRARFGAR